MLLSLLVIFFQTSYSQTIDGVKRRILGNWVSTQDSNYCMLIKSRILLEIYKGSDGVDTITYRISSKNCGIKFKLCNNHCFYLTKVDAGGGKLCYLIKTISTNQLTLVYEGGTVLDFVKPKVKP